ncbi:MAG: hypothetical protein Tsb002_33220 [Wenzhouxiangellaceae bacterium]
MNPLSWHNELWQQLQQRLNNDTLPHALLLHGPNGVGKRQLGQRLARRLLCLEPVDGEACGLCRSCRLSSSGGAHPDWMHAEPPEDKNNILVDQIRELCRELSLSAAFDGYRVATIHAADKMNVNAANALLKTLEEPGQGVLILLIAERAGRLPATIRSRCQPIFCGPPDEAHGLQWLCQHYDGDEARARRALQLAAGAPLLALEWLQQDAIDEADRVRDDLVALVEGRGHLIAIWQAWQEIPAERLWRWVLLDLQQRAREAAGGAQQRLLLLDLQHAAQQCLRLAATPVRDDLQIWQWLLQWQQQKTTQVAHGAA